MDKRSDGQEENPQTEEELVRQEDKMQAKQIDISSKTSRLEVEEEEIFLTKR